MNGCKTPCLPLVALALLTGCGGDSGDPAADGRCILLANGQELCGEKAATWCEGFVTGDPSEQAREACGQFFPALVSDDPVVQDLGEDFDGDGTPNGQDPDPWEP